MKRRALLSLAGLALAARAETAMGSHGMAVFGGREGLYASHLPMFHSPHDSQLVFRIALASAAAERDLRERLAAQPALWTLDPEPFDLLRLGPGHAEPLRQFEAKFFEGHFERGGRQHGGAQRVRVGEVLLFRRLDPSLRERSLGRYRVVGRGREWFAFKEIDRRPDFDHIVRLSGRPQARMLDLPLTGLRQPDLRGPFGVQQAAEIYFETDDLR